MPEILVAAFYQFAAFSDFRDWQTALRSEGEAKHLKGTILLSPEGINGTISGEPENVQAILTTIKSDARFAMMPIKFSHHEEKPFGRWRVRLKREIVTMGEPFPDGLPEKGIHADPAQWNALLADPATLVIDVRNEFEIEYGSFPGAVSPRTKSFTQFKRFVDESLSNPNQRLAIFCTGGIRCEKAAAYLARHGFTDVHQLEGGILRYLQTVPEGENRWQGTCFVFDERESLDESLAPHPKELT